MGLSAGMWTGVSGLLTHGEKMNVVGNNIANMNTLAFKGQRMDFQDFMYQNSYSAAGPTQMGRGVSVGAVMGDFAQGTFEATTEVTDLAIGGNGFFKVKPNGSDTEFYTRAGNFRFNVDGYLNTPGGYTLQGWKIDNTSGPTRATGNIAGNTGNTSQIKGTGLPTDIRLDTWTVEPLQTTKVSFNVNLAPDKCSDKGLNINNPFAAVLDKWNGKQPPAPNTPDIPEDSYSFAVPVKVYDESGATHTLTMYVDKVGGDTYQGGKSGENVWEYVLTMKPSEDMRQVSIPKDMTAYMASLQPGGVAYAGGFDIKSIQETASAGVLMSGTLTFDSAGRLSNQTAYTINGSTKPAKDGNGTITAGNGYSLDASGNPVPVINPDSLADFLYPTEVSSSGFPMIVANFTGMPGADTVGSVPDADKYLMEIDFGLKVSDYRDPWQNSGKSLGSLAYRPITNPMGTGGAGAGGAWDAPALPAIVGPPARPAYPAGVLPIPTAANLSSTDIIRNPDATGTPPYIYKNPSYDARDANSPPYIYANEAAYQTARAAAQVNNGKWPTTGAGLVAADPVMASELSNIKPPAYRQDNAFTSYSGANSIESISQNGYGYGDLYNYTVSQDGVLSGMYSNGVTLPLYQIALYDFTCKQGLRREGSNLFTETRESGAPSSSVPGGSGMGTVQAQQLEGSNVDISREFVQMITTQRGFQSNSKIITTTDTMLETVVNMKR